MKKGKVYLVGAGPGSADLITVKGARCLEEADVVVYDRLLDERLLRRVKAGAELLYAGKAAKEHALSQEEINALLVARAKEGKKVVRLKGGDPFVLGRGGEEAEALVTAGVPFEVVPGVTSAIAAAAYAGIPVTHRSFASSFAVITGHEDPLKEGSSISWNKLACGVDTLVFLMGMENLRPIVAKLIENGRPASTPIALIRNGATPRQQTLVGTLADIVKKAEDAGFAPPTVIVVGEVVRLREKLRWFDLGPLFGKRVLVTRAWEQASLLSTLLAEQGAEPHEMPVIRIEAAEAEALDNALSRLCLFDWIVFTSANGVDAFFVKLREKGLDARQPYWIRFCAIGEATASALRREGIEPHLVPSNYTSQSILSDFRSSGLAQGKRFLLPRADIAGEELAEGLKELGAEVEEVVAYRTVLVEDEGSSARELLLEGKIDVVTFTSSSTVRGLVAQLRGNVKAINNTTVACIGPVTAATATDLGLRVDVVAKKHTIPGLVEALVERFEALKKRPEEEKA